MGSHLHVHPKLGGRRRGNDAGVWHSCGEESEGGTCEPTPAEPQCYVTTAYAACGRKEAKSHSYTHFLFPNKKHRRGKREMSNDGYFRSGGRGQNLSEGTFFYSFDL